MDLENIILNKISQRQIPYDIIYMWKLKPNKQNQNNKTNKNQVHGYREYIGGC